MKIITNRKLWGLLMVGAGVLILLQNLNVLPPISIIWVAAFGVAGLLFLIAFLGPGNSDWAAFPAFTLLGLAAKTPMAALSGP